MLLSKFRVPGRGLIWDIWIQWDVFLVFPYSSNGPVQTTDSHSPIFMQTLDHGALRVEHDNTGHAG